MGGEEEVIEGEKRGVELPSMRIWKIASTRMFKSEVENPRSQKENPTTKPTNKDCMMRPTLYIC